MPQAPMLDDGATWLHHMRQGNFEAAFQVSDKVLQARAGQPCWHWPRHHQYVWDGTPLHGRRVLVRCYHGLGDTIQFVRYAPLIKAIATEVIFWAQPRLIPLLKTAQGIDRLLPLHDGTPEVDYDVDVESMELSHVFRTTGQTIPANIPYLHAAPVPLPGPKEKLAVGLVWQGGDWDEARNIPFSKIAALANVAGIQFYILQANAAEVGWDGSFGINVCGNTLEQDAGTIRSLDLLISADTMTAHLAGALGVPVWTLLQHAADWRWMEGRNDSPWYPTMRLFRQAAPGNWQGVIAQVAAALQEQVRK